ARSQSEVFRSSFHRRFMEYSSNSSSVAFLKICGEVVTEVCVSAEADVVDFQPAAPGFDGLDVCVQCPQVAVANGGGVGEDFRLPFKPAKERGVADWEIEFRAVERVEQHHFVLLIAEVLQAREDVRNVVEQIAEDE